MQALSFPTDGDFRFAIGDTVTTICGMIGTIVQRLMFIGDCYTVEDADGDTHLIVGKALTRQES